MNGNRITRAAARSVVIVALGVALAGCGGGGDSAPVAQPAALIDLTTANRDSVGHATAAGIFAFSPTSTVPLTASSAAAGRERALAAGDARPWSRRLPALLLQPVPAPAAAVPMARALALFGPIVYACTVSGSLSLALDDRDASGPLPSVGDVLTIAYDNCRDTAFETLNGTVTATYTAIGPNSLSARLVLARLSDTAARHAVTLDGSMLLDYSQPGASVEVTTLTAEGPVIASVTSHLVIDTVTLQNGFVEQATHDASVPPPPGSTVAGRTVSGVNGSLESAAAGGTVQVSTDPIAPLTQYDAEAYPRSGALQVKGRSGTLRMTALSADAVRLDLDADGDGIAESSETVSWDWLL